ncbi:MAG: ATP-dependent sacrificial sulfur transferase LarE [Pseudomonadota bacterium]
MIKRDEKTAREKKGKLIQTLKGLDGLLVAFSGGVDSTFLLAVAREVLGDGAVAATACSKTFPAEEQEEAVRFTKERNIQHIVFSSDETDLPEFLSNPPDRCYYCKKLLSQNLIKIAGEMGIHHVAHAANADDLADYRPGMDAAREMGLIAPLLEVSLKKQEIRFLSKEMGLPGWDKPSMACLASRIPYGEAVTEEKLVMVEQAEAYLRKKGFRQCRVRHHGPVARIEVEGRDIKRILEGGLREEIVRAFRGIGFLHVALDLEGYASGRMNRALGREEESL